MLATHACRRVLFIIATASTGTRHDADADTMRAEDVPQEHIARSRATRDALRPLFELAALLQLACTQTVHQPTHPPNNESRTRGDGRLQRLHEAVGVQVGARAAEPAENTVRVRVSARERDRASEEHSLVHVARKARVELVPLTLLLRAASVRPLVRLDVVHRDLTRGCE